MTEMTNGVATDTSSPGASTAARKPKKAAAATSASAPKRTSRTKKNASAKKRSAASSKRGSAPKKRRGKRGAGKVPGHWSKTHAQLVLHATPELVKKLDRKLSALGKRLGCNPTRGAVVRALVERAIK